MSIGSFSASTATTGQQNTIVGHGSAFTLTTGSNNTLVGAWTDVNNQAVVNSTAIGYLAKVSTSNMMVFGNTSVNRWAFGTTASEAKAIVVGNNSTNGNGAYLGLTGTWTNVSDANKKEDFTQVKGATILEQVMKLPITRWKYKGSEDYHIGPTAQDFYRIFKLGTDEVSISTIDPAGIALRAIQELNLQLQEKEAMILALQDEVDQLKHLEGKVDALEATLDTIQRQIAARK